MNMDWHTHVKLSKKTLFTLDYFDEAIAEAREAGLDAIAMTEHYNTLRFHDIYDTLDAHYPLVDDYYAVGDFRVFSGMEVDVAHGGHILTIGPRAAVLALRERLEPHLQATDFVELRRLLDWCDELGLFTVGAHPYRPSNPLTAHAPEQLRRLGALDLNAKDLYKEGAEMQARVQALADELGLPVVGGSDTHHPLQFGSIVNRMERQCDTVAQLIDCVRAGRYRLELSPCLPVRVKAANQVKKLLKPLLQAQAKEATGLHKL